MKITNNIEIIDLALYLKRENILIIADTHIGYEEALNKQGIFVPMFQFKEIILRLENIFKKVNEIEKNNSLKKIINKKNEKTNKTINNEITIKKNIKNTKNNQNTKKTNKISKIIVNGDIKHEFGTISEQEWRNTLQLLDFLAKYCNEIVLIKGNHDTILGPIAEKRKVKVLDSYILDNVLIIHGHKIPKKINKNIKTIIIAHEHPAVGLREGFKTEVFKCFLKGNYKNKELIVMPSFNLVTEGTDVLKGKLLSPFLHQNLKNFECFVIADKVYDFGKLRNL